MIYTIPEKKSLNKQQPKKKKTSKQPTVTTNGSNWEEAGLDFQNCHTVLFKRVCSLKKVMSCCTNTEK